MINYTSISSNNNTIVEVEEEKIQVKLEETEESTHTIKVKDNLNERLDDCYTKAISTKDLLESRRLFFEIIKVYTEKGLKYSKLTDVYSRLALISFELSLLQKGSESNNKLIDESMMYYDYFVREHLSKLFYDTGGTSSSELYQKKFFVITQKMKLCLFNADYKTCFDLYKQAMEIKTKLCNEEDSISIKPMLAEVYYCQAYSTLLDPEKNIKKMKKQSTKFFILASKGNPIFSYMSNYSLAYLNHFFEGEIKTTKDYIKKIDESCKQAIVLIKNEKESSIESKLFKGIQHNYSLFSSLIVFNKIKEVEKITEFLPEDIIACEATKLIAKRYFGKNLSIDMGRLSQEFPASEIYDACVNYLKKAYEKKGIVNKSLIKKYNIVVLGKK